MNAQEGVYAHEVISCSLGTCDSHTIVSIGSEFALQKLNSISVIFCIHQTLPESFGIQLYTYSECLKNKTKGLYHENQLREDSRCGKSVFLIHMSDSKLHIVLRGPKKIQRAWDSTYIFRHTLYLCFQEGLQVC
jgi:hypothetical protein